MMFHSCRGSVANRRRSVIVGLEIFGNEVCGCSCFNFEYCRSISLERMRCAGKFFSVPYTLCSPLDSDISAVRGRIIKWYQQPTKQAIKIRYVTFRHFSLTFWRRIFVQILAHPVFKMWVIQKPNKVALWHKRHFGEKKWRLYSMFKIFSTDICWINIKWGI